MINYILLTNRYLKVKCLQLLNFYQTQKIKQQYFRTYKLKVILPKTI
jgi:hypothetical protein